MNVRAVRAIIRKDLTLVGRSKAVLGPLIAVPVVVFGALPLLVCLLTPRLAGDQRLVGAADLLGKAASVVPGLVSLTPTQQLLYVVTVYLLAPLFLLVPLTVASVISADSFAGEKERRTLEALLYAPMTERDLFVAKVASAWLTAVTVSTVGFVVYASVVNVAGWPVMGRVVLPNVMWSVLVLWVAPGVAAAGLSATVLVSARVRTFQEAYQVGGVVVLPLLALLVAQSGGLLLLDVPVVLVVGLGFWLTAAVLLVLGTRAFRRSALMGH